MDNKSKIKPKTYQITFQGKLDGSWQNWFAGFNFSNKKDAYGNILTTLTGDVIDQAALRGILNKLWDLNFILVAAIRIEKEI